MTTASGRGPFSNIAKRSASARLMKRRPCNLAWSCTTQLASRSLPTRKRGDLGRRIERGSEFSGGIRGFICTMACSILTWIPPRPRRRCEFERRTWRSIRYFEVNWLCTFRSRTRTTASDSSIEIVARNDAEVVVRRRCDTRRRPHQRHRWRTLRRRDRTAACPSKALRIARGKTS